MLLVSKVLFDDRALGMVRRALVLYFSLFDTTSNPHQIFMEQPIGTKA
jgi:hypothetical protein